MVSVASFHKSFLIVTGSAVLFLLLFMIISSQYLTLTTNTLYRDIRAQLFVFGNYTINDLKPSVLSAGKHNGTTIKKTTASNKYENKSDVLQIHSLKHIEFTKASPTIIVVTKNKSGAALRNPPVLLVKKEELPKISPTIVVVANYSSFALRRTPPVLVKKYESCFNFPIDKPDICHREQNIPLLLVIISSVTHKSARNAVRATWGGYASELGIPVFFLLGNTLDRDEQRNVEREDELFEDIVQEGCVDTYKNMTLKTISMMKWIATYCSHVPFVLKSDDDMVVNVDRLLRFVSTLNSSVSQSSIYGRLATKWRPHRNKYSKWYVSPSEYRGSVFPDFTTGPAYLFTSNAASILYQESLNTSFLFLEDVFMTGIVAQKVGVQRIHNRQFHNSTTSLVYRAFGTLITSHGHSPREIRHIWYRHNVYAMESNKKVFKANH